MVEKEVEGFFMNFSNAFTESFLRSAAVLFAARSINIHTNGPSSATRHPDASIMVVLQQDAVLL